MVAHSRLEKLDPTGLTFLYQQFVRDLNKRFRALRGLIRKAIVDQDCFGLGKSEFKVVTLAAGDMNLPGKRAFAFTRSEEKINTFMDWIEEQVNKGLLEVRTLRQVGTSIESIWTNKYIWDSYSRGVQRARREMLGAGYRIPPVDVTGGISTVMGTPIHLERVGLLYSRVFRDLQGITDAMDTQISRVLAQAMIDGKGARQIAKLLTKTISGPVGDLGIKDTLGRFIPAERRARMLARTEMTRAYHLGNVQEMRNFGVAGVTVRAEWVTAGYNVCPECAKLEGRVFSLDEVEGMLPRHPNCRCCVIPQKAQE